MAKHNIQFNGMRHSPSDITGQDGDLLECVNLVHDGGELKPIEMPEKMIKQHGYYTNSVLVAVHNLVSSKMFVFAVYNGVVTYINIKNGDGEDVAINENIHGWGIPQEEILWADTIGNTLIIGTDKSTHYVLFKNGKYKWLGDKLPQPVFEFDMGANNDEECKEVNLIDPIPYCTINDTAGTNGGIYLYNPSDTISGSGDRYTELFPDENNTYENRKIIRDNLRAKMALMMSNSKNAGRFVYPFFVRYALRMYDGNYAMHSSPVLMLPSTTKCPILAYLSAKNQVAMTSYFLSDLILECNTKPLKLRFKGFYNIDGGELNSSIDEWSDIIRGVDLFLSSQIVTFNDSFYDNVDNIPTKYYHSSSDPENIPAFGDAYVGNTKEPWADNNVFDDAADFAGTFYKNQYFPLASYSSEYIEERIGEANLFYRVKKYDLNKLKSEDWSEERYLHNEIEYGLLDRLETLPTLPDDYVSRCRMTGSVDYNYNQRLILGNIILQAPKWYQDSKLFQKANVYNLRICFEIEKPEKTIYVRYDKQIENDWGVGEKDFGHYLFYPDPDCKRAYISAFSGSSSLTAKFIVPMYEHAGLHGSYALMPELKSLYEAAKNNDFGNNIAINIPQESTNRYYQLPNTIAMSTVANPFHFPASNFKDIGRAKVIGIAANVLDVSSAQWGQYPLHVFCSDGIIAVAIDAEGKMGRIDAVSADVLIEPYGLSKPTLIQTNQMLVFLTQRGVMAIAGTKPQVVSIAMEGRHFNPMTELADVDYHVGAFANLITRTSDATSFRDFAASGFLAYDYAHNRVLLLRSDKDYQYVLSLNTMLWSKQIVYTNLPSFQLDLIPSNTLPEQRSNPLLDVVPIYAAVNNYTEMYLQDTDGYLYKTMDVQGENSVKQLYQYGYFISRPVRFGTDEYKSITRLLHEYTHYAKKSFVKMALYGSRDGMKYGRINTLRGMGYKYFIFAVYTYLKPNERYSYMSVEFEPRLTNKIR